MRAEQAKRQASGKKKSNAGKAVLGVLGASAGILIGKSVCKNGNAGCVIGVAATAGSLGVLLGREIDKASERKVTEASYAAALTGQPAAVAIDSGCVLAEPVNPPEFEEREIQLVLRNGVQRPATSLKTIAEFQAPAAAATVVPTPQTKRGGARIDGGKPAFVMGSVSDGRYLLVAEGNEESGYVASGYADAKGWRKGDAPADLAPAASEGQTVALKAQIPCWVSRQTMRTEEGKKARQDTTDIRFCRLPDGTTETGQAS